MWNIIHFLQSQKSLRQGLLDAQTDTLMPNFWNHAKRHMRKFTGIPKEHFDLCLKEYEWRFNGVSPKQLQDDLKIIIKSQ